MRVIRLRVALGLLALIGPISGCSLHDALFGVLGNHYTDGGVDTFDKQRHYESRVEALHEAAY